MLRMTRDAARSPARSPAAAGIGQLREPRPDPGIPLRLQSRSPQTAGRARSSVSGAPHPGETTRLAFRGIRAGASAAETIGGIALRLRGLLSAGSPSSDHRKATLRPDETSVGGGHRVRGLNCEALFADLQGNVPPPRAKHLESAALVLVPLT